MTEALPGAYSNVVAVLTTAGVVGPLFARLKVSPILGFLAAGAALGPQGLGRFVSLVLATPGGSTNWAHRTRRPRPSRRASSSPRPASA